MAFEKSLQDLCLGCIVNNFEKFNSEYQSSVSKIPKRLFEFLQRTFSKTLFDSLYSIGELKEEYLNFLINRHLKDLNLSNQYLDFDLVVRLLKDVGSSVIALDLSNMRTEEDTVIQILSEVPNVEVLNLSRTDISDTVLKFLAKNCPLIKTLNVSFCFRLSDDGIKSLCLQNEKGVVKNTVLENLNILATGITNKGVSFVFPHMPSLRVFNCDNLFSVIYEAHKEDFANSTLNNVQKYHLTEISLHSISGHALSDIIKVCSTLCPDVTVLEVSDVKENTEIQNCALFPNLTEVVFYCYSDDVISSGIETFLKTVGGRLQKFELHGGDICMNSICENCPKLQSLLLSSVDFRDFICTAALPAPCFPFLTSFHCEGVSFALSTVVDSVSFVVSSSPKLQHLSLLYSSSIADSVVDSLIRSNCLSNLVELNVSYTDINVQSLEKLLAATPKLEKLLVEYCIYISGVDYEKLIRLASAAKSDIKIVWNEEVSDNSYSEDEYDMFDDYDDYDYDYEYGDEYDLYYSGDDIGIDDDYIYEE